MATQWSERIVEMRYWESSGRMRVVEIDGSWVGCVPMDADSPVSHLVKLGEDGVLWFRKRDLRECQQQKETLL